MTTVTPGYPETLTITVYTPAQRLAVEKALIMAQELEAVTDTAAFGQVLDCCEEAAVSKGQELTRAMLEQALQQSIDRHEKKEPYACAPAVANAVITKGRKRSKP
jgi:hypothetical protein